MIELSAPIQIIKSSITLSGSKSISNRLLVLDKILKTDLTFRNLSNSEDTALLQKALDLIENQNKETINVHHAGTDMRFLTAYLSVKEGEWTLTGSERMKQRPIGELVTALRTLGADITFLEKENYPPLLIHGKKLAGGAIEIESSVSSQFISALLLISPTFGNGLKLTLKGETVSMPYIHMTVALLKSAGIRVEQRENHITVLPSSPFHLPPENYKDSSSIESDWSSASYWYGICAFCKDAEIELNGLHKHSLQADAVLPEIYKDLGVKTTFKEGSVLLRSIPPSLRELDYDFTDCPDIAQTIAVTCFGLGIKANLTGLSTLKVKETDRLAALKTELDRLGAQAKISSDSIQINGGKDVTTRHQKPEKINTYNDHRMAMSFAPLALLYKSLLIDDPSVVSKSYPAFWEDLKSVGFNVNLQA